MADKTITRPAAHKQYPPFSTAEVVTKSDTVDFPLGTCSALYVGGTGDVNAITAGGQTVVFSAVPAGTTLNVRLTRVKSTSTTASLMVALS